MKSRIFRIFDAGNALGAVLAAVALLLGATTAIQAQTYYVYSLTNVWYVPTNMPGGNNLIIAGDNNRGLAYDINSNQVFVAAKGGSSPAPGIEVLDAATGNPLGLLDKTVVSGGSFLLNEVKVAQDGAIYAANLVSPSTPTSPTRIYRWTNWQSLATMAYVGNAISNPATAYTITSTPGQRVGDTMDVTGSGTNTTIVMTVDTSSPNLSTNAILFTTSDGINFTNHILAISGFTVSGSGICGVSFYTNNTFMIRTSGGTGNNVYLVQYPANIASLGAGPIPATVIGSYPLPSVLSTTAFIDYKSAGQGGFFAEASPQNSGGASGSAQVALYSDPVLGNTGCSIQLAATNYPHLTANGNQAGGVALGGAGYSQYIFSLDCNNGVRCSQIVSVPAQKPNITAQPASLTFFAPYTLTVSASGFCPITYQWQESNSITGTFTNIPGQTTSSYTITGAVTNSFQVVITNPIGAVTSTVANIKSMLPITNSAVSSLWRIAPAQSGYPWLSSSDDNERGLAYDTNSQRVVVGASSGLYVLNATTGASIETLSLTGVTFGGSLNGCDQVVIADDGAVYAGNLATSGANFNLYRWAAPSNSVAATLAYQGNPGNNNADRWGDSMAVRGGGTNTQILLSSRASAPGGTNVVLFLPNDGVGKTYSPNVIAVSGVPAGFAGYGISFGAGNTFWAKSYLGDLFEIAFDTNTLTGTVVFDYRQPSQIGTALVGLGVDPANNIMATVQPGDRPNDLQLYQLTGTSDAPVLFQQAFFATANANGNENAAVVVKYPRMYALDVNNGIVALTYGTPAATAPTITAPPANTTAYTVVPSVTLSVGASGSLPLYYQWRFDGTNIPGATSSTYTLTDLNMSMAGNYDVIVHNIAGSVTSTPPAVLTLIVPVTSPVVNPVWAISAGTNGAYLTTSGYETRGMAFDLTTSNLFVADSSSDASQNHIHMYNGTNGNYIADVNTAGLPTGGVNGWVVDQLGVADDGTLYSCNLSTDGRGFSIISYSPGNYFSNYAYGGADGGSDLNTLDPIGDRWGDTMAVRGSGPNTQILLGSYNGTNVALFTTADGVTFTPTVIAVKGGVPLGFASLGIAFGTNNTFYAKGGHFYNLRWVSFDANANTGTVLQNYVGGTQVPNDLTGLGVDVSNNILGGVCFNDSPDDAQLYLLSGNSNAPALFEQDFFPTNNANAQENAVVDLKGGWGFALDVNNGILAFTYGVPSTPAVKLTTVAYAPGNTVITWNNTFDTRSYQVQYKDDLLDPTWTNLGAPVTATDATASYSDTTATGATRFYRVISQ